MPQQNIPSGFIEHGSGKSTIDKGFHRNITYKWSIFHCHVRLPEGSPPCHLLWWLFPCLFPQKAPSAKARTRIPVAIAMTPKGKAKTKEVVKGSSVEASVAAWDENPNLQKFPGFGRAKIALTHFLDRPKWDSYAYIYIYVNMHIYIYIHICIYTCISIYIYICHRIPIKPSWIFHEFTIIEGIQHVCRQVLLRCQVGTEPILQGLALCRNIQTCIARQVQKRWLRLKTDGIWWVFIPQFLVLNVHSHMVW